MSYIICYHQNYRLRDHFISSSDLSYCWWIFDSGGK